MKISFSILIFLSLILHSTGAQDINNRINDGQNGNQMLYGIITEKALLQEPYKEWYRPAYNSYSPDESSIMNLLENHAGVYQYYIILGTWCSDSRVVVPKMMKVLKEAGVHEDNIILIAVDRDKKVEDMNLRKMKIKRVPTLIVDAGGHEIGRIVETPQTTVEKDLEIILTGE